MNSINNQIINDPKQLGLMVRSKRDQLGLRQAEAAALCQVGTRFLSDVENGKPSLHIGKVLNVLRGLGLILTLSEKGGRT